MRIGGKTLDVKNTKEVHIFRGDEKITMTVGPAPAKLMDKLEDSVFGPVPKPPKKASMTASGIPITRGEGKNKEVVMVDDRDDPTYKAAWSEYYSLVIAARAAAYLSHDPQFQFDAKKPSASPADDPQGWKEYITAVRDELKDEDTGFTNDELHHILDVGSKTELCLDIDEAKKVFSQSHQD